MSTTNCLIFSRAETYRHLGDFESAIGDYLSAITHDHDDADSMKYLAVCYQQQGRLEEAITYYSASIDLGELRYKMTTEIPLANFKKVVTHL